MSEIEQARTSLIEALVAARQEYEYRKSIYAKPNSGHDAEAAYHQSFGRWSGIAKAVEILDKVTS